MALAKKNVSYPLSLRGAGDWLNVCPIAVTKRIHSNQLRHQLMNYTEHLNYVSS